MFGIVSDSLDSEERQHGVIHSSSGFMYAVNDSIVDSFGNFLECAGLVVSCWWPQLQFETSAVRLYTLCRNDAAVV